MLQLSALLVDTNSFTFSLSAQQPRGGLFGEINCIQNITEIKTYREKQRGKRKKEKNNM